MRMRGAHLDRLGRPHFALWLRTTPTRFLSPVVPILAGWKCGRTSAPRPLFDRHIESDCGRSRSLFVFSSRGNDKSISTLSSRCRVLVGRGGELFEFAATRLL